MMRNDGRYLLSGSRDDSALKVWERIGDGQYTVVARKGGMPIMFTLPYRVAVTMLLSLRYGRWHRMRMNIVPCDRSRLPE